MSKNFRGITAPVLVPYEQDGRVNEAVFRQLVRRLVESGVQGIFVGGTTGEFINLTKTERQRLLELAVESAGGAVVLYNITAMNLAEVQEHIAFAKQLGIRAVSVTAPYYHKYDKAALARYFTTISGLTRGLDLYIYNMPGMTGNPVGPELLAELRRSCPNLCGVKDSSMDFTNLEEIKTLIPDPEFEVITGNDAEVLAALQIGCPGAIVALANVYPEICTGICTEFAKGDVAAAWALQQKLIRLRGVCRATMPIMSQKYLLELKGFPMGPARFPLRELRPEEKQLLRAAAEGL